MEIRGVGLTDRCRDASLSVLGIGFGEFGLRQNQNTASLRELDCRADRFDDGKFGLRLSLERSWVQGDVRVPVDRSIAQPGGTSGEFKEPVIGQYKTDVYLLVRDGQTVESTVATDPLTGNVLKIELTLTVLK